MLVCEVDVMRLIYRMAAVERKSCFKIADHLNQLGIPCAYIRDDRLILRGKRKEKTSGMWRPSRVRNLIVSTTYMGLHEYGKRTQNPHRQIITRKVPPIVSEDTWRRAQQALKANFLFGKRNARRQYLLRGLVKCGLCQLTYVGVAANRSNCKAEFYYRCNGKYGFRGHYGKQGQHCPSKSIRGEYLEPLIWQEVEQFLRNPGEVVEHLRARLASDVRGAGSSRAQVMRLENTLRQKASERDKVVGLFRRGRIETAALDRQLDDIAKEETALRTQIELITSKLRGVEAGDQNLASAEALLQKLRRRLDEPISWEIKRQLIEIFVAGIRMDTIEVSGKKANAVAVTYRFASSVDNCTDIRVVKR
jgi:site-specific DNA recombinase